MAKDKRGEEDSLLLDMGNDFAVKQDSKPEGPYRGRRVEQRELEKRNLDGWA